MQQDGVTGKKNNERPAWLEKQKSIKTTFLERIEALPEWKQKAFYMMFDDAESGEVAKATGKDISYVSRWRHSEEYVSLMLTHARVLYLDKIPASVKFITGLMDPCVEVTVEDTRKKAVAEHIIKKTGLFGYEPEGTAGGSGNKTQINIITMPEKELEKAVADKIRNIKILTGEKEK